MTKNIAELLQTDVRYMKHYKKHSSLMIDGLGASDIYISVILDRIVAVNNEGQSRSLSKEEYFRELNAGKKAQGRRMQFPYLPHDPRGTSIFDVTKDIVDIKTRLFYRYIKIPYTRIYIRLWRKKPKIKIIIENKKDPFIDKFKKHGK